jgi:hypothetical protein
MGPVSKAKRILGRKRDPILHSSQWGPRSKFLASFLFLVLFGNIFLFLYLLQERTIPSWDHSCYEFKFVEAVRAFETGPSHFFKTVLDSIAHSDNSLLIPSLLAPWGAALGTDRAHFLFMVFNLLAVPGLLALTVFFSRLAGLERYDPSALIPMLLVLLNPFFWIPLVRGYYDIASWAVMLLIWGALLGKGGKIEWRRAVLAGVGLTALIFMRRWLGYWAVSFPIALALLWAWARVAGKRPLWGLGPIAVTAATAFLTFLVIAPHFLVHALTEDQVALHEAYKRGLPTILSVWKGITDHGLLAWSFAGLGAYWAWKGTGPRWVLALIPLQSVLALVLFARVQNLDPHHQTPFVLLLALCQSFFLLHLFRKGWGRPWKIGVGALFFFCVLLNFPGPLEWNARDRKTFHLLVEEKAPPERRRDLSEIQRLIGYLGSQKAQSIQVLSASQGFNATTLQNAAYYLRFDDRGTCAKVLFSPTVDVRDGFPWSLFQADLVVVADPFQYQLRPQDQLVIGLPAQALLEGKGIGKAFRELPQKFHLDGGATARVYRRSGKIKFSDVEALNEALREAHPNSGKFSREVFSAGVRPRRAPSRGRWPW